MLDSHGPATRGATKHQSSQPSDPPHDEPEGDEAFKTPLYPVYRAIVEYQKGADWWANRDELAWLRDWGQRFIKEFSLKTKDAELLPMPLIKIEPMNIKTICSYKNSIDGYGLKGVIVFNEKRLNDVPPYMKLAMLLRELFRAWQDQRCRDPLFEKERRQRWKELGLNIGRTSIAIEEGRRFHQLLSNHEIEAPADEIRVPDPKGASRSTLALWTCLCKRARVATGVVFNVRCQDCHTLFRLGDHVIFRWSKADPRENGAH